MLVAEWGQEAWKTGRCLNFPVCPISLMEKQFNPDYFNQWRSRAVVKSLLLAPYVEYGPKTSNLREVKWYTFDLLATSRKDKNIHVI